MARQKQPPGVDPGQEGARPKSRWREYGESVFIALALALIIRAFVIQAFSIPSSSMEPTLLVGDYLLVNKFSYGIRNPFTNKIWISTGKPQRGDITVFIYPQDPTKDYIKRVIGLPGDRIQITNKKLYINGQLTQIPPPSEDPQAPRAVYREKDITPTQRDNFGPMVVPPNAYFVMGDNRDKSYDSRFWGFVSLDAMRGKAFIIYFSWQGQTKTFFFPSLLKGAQGLIFNFSWNDKVFQVRWDRIGKLIH